MSLSAGGTESNCQ